MKKYAALFLFLCIAISLFPVFRSRFRSIEGFHRVDLKENFKTTHRIYKIKELLENHKRSSQSLSVKQLVSPLFFQKNIGQADKKFSFITRSVNFAAGFTPTSFVAGVVRHLSDAEINPAAETKGNVLQFTFKEASEANLTGQETIRGSINSIIGKDPAHWYKKIPAFRSLRYHDLYPGIQMSVELKTGLLEYGFVVNPNADLKKIRIAVDGVENLKIDSSGNLIMKTSGGPIVQTAPVFFEKKPGDEDAPLSSISGGFELLGPKEYGFKVERRTPDQELIIDPRIVFSTYFGGSNQEGMLGSDDGAMDFIGRGFDISFSPDNEIFLIGMTTSTDFPVTSGAMTGSGDVFVMRADPTLAQDSQLIYATFIGGSSSERGRAVAPLAGGQTYITGHTDSSDFPTSAGVVQPTRQNSGAYLARLTPDGLFDIGTFIGKTASQHPNSVSFNKRASENDGFVYIAGSVRNVNQSDALPNSFQPEYAGGNSDGFLAKLNSELTQFNYFTYFGGSNQDTIMDLDVNDGFAFITGSTSSSNLPITDIAFQSQHSQSSTGVDCSSINDAPRSCFDAFVARFNRAGDGLIYSTYLGADREEYARGIAVSSTNQATITGAARSIDGDSTEIFATRLEGGGENILWDDRANAQRTDHGEEIVVDSLGRAHFTGTISVDGLSTGIRDSETFHGGSSDIFYSRITNTGTRDHFTYLGGSATDRGFAVASVGTTERNFCVAIAGSTSSTDIETVNALEGGEEFNGGNSDLLVYGLCDVEGTITPSNFSKSGSPQTATPGESITYTLTVTNGADVGIPISISDPVPENVTVTGVAGQGCTRSAGSNTVNCSLVAQPGSTTVTITGQIKGDQNCPSSFTNTATVTVGDESFSKSATTTVRCPPPLCPNGQVDSGEQCDDGNSRPNDGCREGCLREFCGDGIVQSNEQCDDGNTDDNDHCTNGCLNQPIAHESCSSTGPACAGNLVCGKRCGYVENDGCLFFIFFCDSYWLCGDPVCMPEDQATIVHGP